MSPAVVTEDRVRVIVNECIQSYENVTGSVRHRDNLKEFGDIKAMQNEQVGATKAVLLICKIIAFLITIGFTYIGVTAHFKKTSTNVPEIHANAPTDASN